MDGRKSVIPRYSARNRNRWMKHKKFVGLRMYRYNDENPQIPAQRDVKGGEDFVAFQPFLVFNMKLEGFPIRCKDL